LETCLNEIIQDTIFWLWSFAAGVMFFPFFWTTIPEPILSYYILLFERGRLGALGTVARTCPFGHCLSAFLVVDHTIAIPRRLSLRFATAVRISTVFIFWILFWLDFSHSWTSFTLDSFLAWFFTLVNLLYALSPRYVSAS